MIWYKHFPNVFLKTNAKGSSFCLIRRILSTACSNVFSICIQELDQLVVLGALVVLAALVAQVEQEELAARVELVELEVGRIKM